MALISNAKRFFTQKFNFGKSQLTQKERKACVSTPLTLISVVRQRNMDEQSRRKYATEQIDSFYGFSLPYLRWLIDNQINNKTIALEMKRLAVALPLLKKFISSISKVYNQTPQRSFFIDDKEIVDEIPYDILDKEKYIENKELLNILNSFYNKKVSSSLKEAEQLTNLLKTTIYKIITNEEGNIEIKFIPNDTVQVCQNPLDPNFADEIAFIRDDFSNDRSILRNTKVLEQWNVDTKMIPLEKEGQINNIEEEININEASREAEKLFNTKKIGSAFAPFVVFRESDPSNTFWNIKDADTFDYIKAINMNLTELRYLIRYASFGLKYVINAKMDFGSTSDPTGFLSFQSASRVPGDADNIQVGEFENKGRIKEVIEAIIFNLKMLYDNYNLPLDSLISSNSVRSAENKQIDNENLFAYVNSQRDIWYLNEQNLFKVMQSVWNRDSSKKIPKGVELRVDFEELETQEKTQEEWMVELQNNISSVLDWIGAENPDLNNEELQRLYERNISLNSMKSETKEDVFEESQEEDKEEFNNQTNQNDRNNTKS